VCRSTGVPVSTVVAAAIVGAPGAHLSARHYSSDSTIPCSPIYAVRHSRWTSRSPVSSARAARRAHFRYRKQTAAQPFCSVYTMQHVATTSENLLTVSHTARELGESEGTIRRKADSGALPCLRTSSGARLFKPADVAAARAKTSRV
jgi:hypothetical protein